MCCSCLRLLYTQLHTYLTSGYEHPKKLNALSSALPPQSRSVKVSEARQTPETEKTERALFPLSRSSMATSTSSSNSAIHSAAVVPYRDAVSGASPCALPNPKHATSGADGENRIFKVMMKPDGGARRETRENGGRRVCSEEPSGQRKDADSGAGNEHHATAIADGNNGTTAKKTMTQSHPIINIFDESKTLESINRARKASIEWNIKMLCGIMALTSYPFEGRPSEVKNKTDAIASIVLSRDLKCLSRAVKNYGVYYLNNPTEQEDEENSTWRGKLRAVRNKLNEVRRSESYGQLNETEKRELDSAFDYVFDCFREFFATGDVQPLETINLEYHERVGTLRSL